MAQIEATVAAAIRRPEGIAAIQDLLACPVCSGALKVEAEALRCAGCGARYAIGHVREDGRDLFVTPGLGTSILPVRFRVPPEISLLTVGR